MGVEWKKQGGRAAWRVFVIAELAYMVGIFNRSSLGVAGVLATERFGLSATQLSSFSVLQLAVYASMQIPVGVLIDRFGPRRLLTVGCSTMAVAQLAFALVGSYPAAVAARVMLGIGDAMMFISVMRIVLAWFPPGRVPLMSQLVGQFGQIGAIGAATPLTLVLRHLGWETAFLISASVGLLTLVMVVLIVRDSPNPNPERARLVDLATLRGHLATAWRQPGTRLGLWTHFTAQFAQTVFLLLWGYPFLVIGQGLSEETAGTLLISMTFIAILIGPLMGQFTARFPWNRSNLVLTTIGVCVASWVAVLAWPGRAPVWLLVILTTAIAVAGPASTVGFDYARTSNPASSAGTANGIVNVGGFIAGLGTILLIGMVLDHLAPDGRKTLADFKWAMSVHFIAYGLGTVQILRLRRLTRDQLAERNPERFAELRARSLPPLRSRLR